jgi:hypothetical protein
MTDTNFIPSYSTLNGIFLENDSDESYDIFLKNIECQYERLETIENINEVFPNGSLIVRDTRDIVTFINYNLINKIKFTFMDGLTRIVYITSVTYLNNAASDTEENFVSINFSNNLYKKTQQTALLDLLPNLSPQVFLISDFISQAAGAMQTVARVVDKTSNYMVYRPLTEIDSRVPSPADNTIQYINYISNFACGENSCEPRYVFWTNWAGEFVFKYFERTPENDPYGTDDYIDSRTLRYKIYDQDNPSIQFRSYGDKVYKKIYYMCTDPADQFISKNYYYYRKTPKILDTTPVGVDAYDHSIQSLMYQYQDEGQKYNIELISSNKTNNMVAGADEIICDTHWGYYNTFSSANNTPITNISEKFGTESILVQDSYVGITGYFPYVDNTHMWKMMFDFTEIHPNYPDASGFFDNTIEGETTYLQTILDIKQTAFNITQEYKESKLDLIRKIEKENFIMYALCCMAKEDQSFFAMLTRYEKDTTYGAGLSGGSAVDMSSVGGFSGSTYSPYRYKWVKLNFDFPYGLTAPDGNVSPSGGTAYYFHNIEAWKPDDYVKSSETVDDTWAINLNERSVAKNYLPPGWSPASSLPSGFNWRPIGVIEDSSGNYNKDSGITRHIVKMNAVSVSDLLLDSKQLVPSQYLGKYLYYFTATNIVDGRCV